MQAKLILPLVILLVQSLYVSQVWAAAPAEGMVVEGVSVPGIELGSSREQVESVYGLPSFCQSIFYGDRASCMFAVTGGGQVNIRYEGPEGGSANNSPYDVVHSVTFYQGANWTTTAGITAAIAQNNPDQLPLAYPNAKITYHNFTGEIFKIEDAESGISITRWFNFYTGKTITDLTIYPGEQSN